MKKNNNDALSFLNNELFNESLSDVKTGKLAEMYEILKRIESAAKGRKEFVRDILMPRVAELGGASSIDSKSLALFEDGYEVAREKRVDSSPDLELTKELVAKKGIPIKQVFDEVMHLEPNPSKISYLVSVGKITQEEADSLYKTKYAIKVVPPKKSKKVND